MENVAGDQWKAAKAANVLIFNFDHFDTREKGLHHTEVDKARLAQHEKLLKEILSRIRDEKKEDIAGIIILLTKKDLWMSGRSSAAMVEWSESLQPRILDCYSSYLPDRIHIRPFSKDDASDLKWLIQELSDVAR
jgi:hypothetical protein